MNLWILIGLVAGGLRSWYTGANIPGKPRQFLGHRLGSQYFNRFPEVAEADFEDFAFEERRQQPAGVATHGQPATERRTYGHEMTTQLLNILLILTDEERYQPDYERDQLADFRRTRLPARSSFERAGLQWHRHYTAATACAPSRTSLFTGQYPSLHGVRNTDGIGKSPHDLPTMGHCRYYDADRRTDEESWELHDLSGDPGERDNKYRQANAPGSELEDLLVAEREAKRLTPLASS